MMDFRIRICEPGCADVFLDTPSSEIPWALVEQLDRADIRVIASPAGHTPSALERAQLVKGCAGLISLEARSHSTDDLSQLNPNDTDPDVCIQFVSAVRNANNIIRPYAFFVGRLERDFDHARSAIRTATELVAGMPLLWADDGLHQTNVESVRQSTRWMIRHAAFVIADLTLGVESPNVENPSRAHEIGMAIAYERPVLLCSQEPRRYPYFAVADMQMMFWQDEAELGEKIGNWIRLERPVPERRVLNYELTAPVIARPQFAYDPARRYIGPRTPRLPSVRRLWRTMTVRS